ncbi:MAG: hypothetical protein KIS86_14670 [Devosia sp.]|nr:hypothetical protein [Devosia sp.]
MSWRRLLGDEGANMVLLFATAFSLAVILSAISVDASALYYERRQLQAGVDLAAIAAAGDPSRARERAEAALVDAGLGRALDTGVLEVTVGNYAANPALQPDRRFTPNIAPLNAALVEMRYPGTLYFASGITAPPAIAARGLARVIPEVSFTLGSRLASLDGGIANALLSTLLGTTISLSVMDYNRLAAARVNALDFLDALAIEMGIEAGSYDDLLAARPGAGQIAAALARIVNGTERGLLHTIALSGKGNRVVLRKLFDLGRLGRLDLYDDTAALVADLSVLEILTAAAALADGTRQVHLSLASTLPGITRFELDLVIGEPPQGGWFTLGPTGTVVRTAQLRLRLALRLLAGSVVSGGVLNLPIWLDLAPAQARVVGATCPSAAEPRGGASIAVLPGVVTLAIGALADRQMVDFATPPPLVPVKLIDVALLDVAGSARVRIAQSSPLLLEFSTADIAAGALKTARTQTLASSLVASLLGDLNLSIDILGLGLGLPDVVAKSVRALLAPLASPLDLVLANLLRTLGLGLGEADLRVYEVRCTNAVLIG